MSPTIEKHKDARISVTFVIPAEDVVSAEVKAIQRIAHHVDVPGFRPGKAPAAMVKERVRTDALMEEIVRVLLPDLMKVAMEKSGAKPILQPKVGITKTDPLTVVITFVERPAVTLKKAEKLSVEKKVVAEVTAEDVDAFIRKLLMQDRTETVVQRASERGDLVSVALEATTAKGDNVPELTVSRYSVMLDGSEELIPDLTEALINVKEKDVKTVKVSFAKDHDIPAVQGQKITLKCTVLSVAAITLPELNEAYLNNRLKTEKTIDAFKADVKDMLTYQRKDAEMKRREDALYEAVKAAVDVTLSAELITAELEEMIADLAERLKKQGVSMEDWLKTTGKKAEEVIAEMRSIAEGRVKLRLGMQELAQAKKVEVTDEEITNVLGQMEKDRGTAFSDDEKRPGGHPYETTKFDLMMQKLVNQMIADE